MIIMEEGNILERIKEFHEKGRNEERNSTIREFKRIHYTDVYNYAKRKFPEKQKAEDVAFRAFNQFITAIIQFGFTTENYKDTLTRLVAIEYYSEQLRTERTKDFDNYITIEKNLRKSLLPFLHHINMQIFSNKNCNCLIIKEKEVSLEWISMGAFEIFVTKVLSTEQGFPDVKDINSFVIDGYYLFVLRYVLNPIWVERIEELVNKIHKKAFLKVWKKKELKEEIGEVSTDTNLRFYEQIRSDDFIFRTNIINFWKGIFENIQQEYIRKNSKAKKVNINQQEEKYENQPVEKYEVFEFLQDGLEAIKDFKDGKARELLAFGGRSNLKFNQIIQEALLDNTPKDFGKPFHYKNKSVENEQRKDCKKELIKWMKAIVKNNDPENKWYGKKGIQIIKFITEKNIDEL
jgi:hypothetical protein